MSTQQNNAEAADGHSFADKIGQLVSAKYQALFGTTTYSKRRVMSGVVMTRYVGNMVLLRGHSTTTWTKFCHFFLSNTKNFPWFPYLKTTFTLIFFFQTMVEVCPLTF